MKRLYASCLTATMLLAPLGAYADGYVMGAGQWTCAEVVRVYDSGTGIEKGQVFGWIMGYWSSATFHRETKFIDTVEKFGGLGISEATVARCRKASPETLLHKLTDDIIRNTK